jgi:malate synthase
MFANLHHRQHAIIRRIAVVREELSLAEAASVNALMAWYEGTFEDAEKVLHDRARKVHNLRGLLAALHQELKEPK